VATAVLFGTAPALRGARLEPTETLKALARGVIGEGRLRPAHLLVVLQVALSLVLLVAAGLFLRTFSALANTALGFEAGPILIARTEAPAGWIPASERPVLFGRILEAARRVPGVSDAALSHVTPLGNDTWNNRIELPGRPPLSIPDRLTFFNRVSPGWFKAYGTRLLEGRDFTEADRPGSPPVAIVNEAFARRFNGGKSPIGMKVRHRNARVAARAASRDDRYRGGLRRERLALAVRGPIAVRARAARSSDIRFRDGRSRRDWGPRGVAACAACGAH